MSLKQFKAVLDPLVTTQGTKIPFILSKLSNAQGDTLYSSTTLPEDDTRKLLAMYSGSKPVTITAILQLHERGLVNLNDDLDKYLPEARNPQIIHGWDENTGKPILKPAKNKIKLIHAVTHTAGMGYPLFNQKYQKLSHMLTDDGKPQLRVQNLEWEQVQAPLLFEPGTRWLYSFSTDWVGKVVEKVTGVSLDTYCKENIFSKLGMENSTFIRNEEQYEKSFQIIQHKKDGTSELLPKTLHKRVPSMCSGGIGLWSTVDDYIKFLQIFLNDGSSPLNKNSILKPETIHNYSFKNLLPPEVKNPLILTGAQSAAISPQFFPPGVNTSWTAQFMKNESANESTGKNAGSLTWYGMSNIYYFVDPVSKITGIWATAVFPFFYHECKDKYLQWEKGVYDVHGTGAKRV